MSNFPTATCFFQKYVTWCEYVCDHPKNIEAECKKQCLCSHRELRRKCELAKNYHIDNYKYIETNRVKACSQIEDCKRRERGLCPECTVQGVKDWAQFYKKKFEVK